MRATHVSLAAAALLAGCAADDGFPSLAPRPGERDLSLEEPERPAVAAASEPALLAAVAALLRQAGEGERAFAAAHGAAAAAVGAAGRPESEGWVAAQMALSRLEAARTPTARALAELDRLAVDRAGAPTAAEDFAAILEARAEAGRLAETQQARIAALRARLSGP